MKKRYIFLSLILIALIMGAAIGSTISYFTTYTYARGGQTLHLGYSTRIKEDFSGKEKRLVITNDEGSQPVYVRARAFSAQDLEISGANWSKGTPAGNNSIPDKEATEYWYYAEPLPGTKGLSEGERSTTTLSVKITFPDEAKADDEFGVVVIYESTPVKYDTAGNPYADWTEILDVIREEG